MHSLRFNGQNKSRHFFVLFICLNLRIFFITIFRVSMVKKITIYPNENLVVRSGRNRSKFMNAAEYTFYFDIDVPVSINTGWLKFSFVIWMLATILKRMLALFMLAALLGSSV